MVAARPGRIDAVLVCKLDRFGRSALDLLTNLRELESSGFSLYRIGILVADQLFVSGAGFAPSCHRVSKKAAMRLSVSAIRLQPLRATCTADCLASVDRTCAQGCRACLVARRQDRLVSGDLAARCGLFEGLARTPNDSRSSASNSCQRTSSSLRATARVLSSRLARAAVSVLMTLPARFRPLFCRSAHTLG